MSTKWQTIITAAGLDDQAFFEAGFKVPKNLVPVQGATILTTAINSYMANPSACHVMIAEKEAQTWETSKFLQSKFKSLAVHTIPNRTRGALCTAAMSVDYLDPDLPLILAPGDSAIFPNIRNIIDEFIFRSVAAGTIVFEDSNPRWSFARIAKLDRITEMVEKSPISTHASTGIFYFSSVEKFKRATEWVLRQNMHLNGEFYISSALNWLIMDGELVNAIRLPSDYRYVPLSTPQDLIIYEGSNS